MSPAVQLGGRLAVDPREFSCLFRFANIIGSASASIAREDLVRAMRVLANPGIVDRSKKADVQREMRRQIRRRLPGDVYGKDEQERLAAALIDLLKVRKG